MLAISVVPSPAWAQAEILGFDVEAPDLSGLFRARLPPSECPVGHADDLDALPPGSHLLHLGVRAYFLDFRARLNLSPNQIADLRVIRQDAETARAEREEQIGRTEEELWELTGAGRPDLEAIEAKVEEIERERLEERVETIRAVVQAAARLTESQRQALLGLRPAAGASP